MKKIEKKKITEEQETAWFEAIYNKNIETIKRMIKEGIDVNLQDSSGWTALHDASYWGNIDITNLLIDNGADVNVKDTEDWTALHLACYYGKIEASKLLIKHEACINVYNKWCKTPLDDLKANHPKQYEELIEWLTEHHPDKMLEVMASEIGIWDPNINR